MGDFHPDDRRAKLVDASRQLAELTAKVAERGQAKRDEMAQVIDRMQDRMDAIEVARQKGGLGGSDIKEYHGPFATKGEPLRFENQRRTDFDAKNVRVGALFGAMALGQEFSSRLNDDEQKALLSVTGPGGDYLVNEAVSGPLIEAVRAQMRVNQAGAKSFVMPAQTTRIPGWAQPIAASWAGEFVALQDGGGSFRALNFISRAVGAVVSLSTELLEDSTNNIGDVSQIVEAEISRAIAHAIDKAVLIGAGTSDEPLGFYPKPSGRADIAVQSMGVNGAALTNYDPLIQLVGSIRAQNFEPNAIILAPRTTQELGTLKDGQQRYLNPPDYLSDVDLLDTGQIPVNFTKGSSNAASIAVAGQWDQVLIGYRPQIGARTIVDPYSKASQRVVNIVVWTRCDWNPLQANAFAVLDGLL